MVLCSRQTLMLLGVILAASCISVNIYASTEQPTPEIFLGPLYASAPVPPTIPQLIEQEALRAGIDPALLSAIVQHESGGDSLAVNPDDPSYGLGQVMPKWWRYVFIKQCGDEATPETLMRARLNLCYAAHILAYASSRFDGDQTSIISYYNTGTPHRGVHNGYNSAVSSLFARAD